MCGRLFTPDILSEFLPEDMYKKYCDHALQFNKIFGLEDYELLTNCLNETCAEKYIIWKDAGTNNSIKNMLPALPVTRSSAGNANYPSMKASLARYKKKYTKMQLIMT